MLKVSKVLYTIYIHSMVNMSEVSKVDSIYTVDSNTKYSNHIELRIKCLNYNKIRINSLNYNIVQIKALNYSYFKLDNSEIPFELVEL